MKMYKLDDNIKNYRGCGVAYINVEDGVVNSIEYIKHTDDCDINIYVDDDEQPFPCSCSDDNRTVAMISCWEAVVY